MPARVLSPVLSSEIARADNTGAVTERQLQQAVYDLARCAGGRTTRVVTLTRRDAAAWL